MRTQPLSIITVLGLTACLGCQTMPWKKADEPLPVEAKPAEVAKLPWKSDDGASLLPWKNDGPEYGTPTQIVATWTDTVLQQSGNGAKRGFGGRLYFYGSDRATPIAVEGQLVVYAFDETGRESTDNRPNKRYVFPPEQFALHQSESDLGVSYSFWLPWDGMNGLQKDVSLIARFEPVRGGTLVVSDQSQVRLPGRFDGPSVVPEKQIATRIGNVQTVSHEAPAQPTPAAAAHVTAGQSTGVNQRIETTTIALPRGTRPHQRMTSAASAVSAPSVSANGVQTTIRYSAPGGSLPEPSTAP